MIISSCASMIIIHERAKAQLRCGCPERSCAHNPNLHWRYGTGWSALTNKPVEHKHAVKRGTSTTWTCASCRRRELFKPCDTYSVIQRLGLSTFEGHSSVLTCIAIVNDLRQRAHAHQIAHEKAVAAAHGVSMRFRKTCALFLRCTHPADGRQRECPIWLCKLPNHPEVLADQRGFLCASLYNANSASTLCIWCQSSSCLSTALVYTWGSHSCMQCQRCSLCGQRQCAASHCASRACAIQATALTYPARHYANKEWSASAPRRYIRQPMIIASH